MAKIYLEAGDTSYNVSNNNSSVIDSAGVANTVTINSGLTGISIASTVEDIDFTGAVADYTFQQVTGTADVNVLSGGVVVATLTNTLTARTASFTDGTVAIATTVVGTDIVSTVGGTTITTTAAAVTPTTIDATSVTTATTSTGGTTPTATAQAYTLTTGDDISGIMTSTTGATTNDGDDTFTATNLTYTANDVLLGGTGTDTLTITAAGAVAAAASVVGVETINFVASNATATYNASNVVSSTINMSSSSPVVTSATVTGAGATTTVVAADSITGTLNVTGTGTKVTGANASTVAATLSADAATMYLTVDDDTNTINLDAASATAGTVTDKATISGIGTITLDVEVTNDKVVENLTLSGNGAAVNYDITSGSTVANTVETIAVTGDQDVTITIAAAAIAGLDAAADWSDTSTAGTTTVILDTAVASEDLTHVKAGVIKTGVVNNGTAAVIANNANIHLNGDTGTGTFTLSSTELTTGNETINLEVQATQTTGSVVLTDFEVINLNVNEVATTPTGLVTINGLTGTETTTTGSDINITGSTNLTLTAVTADNIVATNFTGNLTVGTADLVNHITGGTGNDSVTVSTDDLITFVGGAGNDTLNVASGTTSNGTTTFTSGAGADTLVITSTGAIGDRFTTDFGSSDYLVANVNTTMDARDLHNATFNVAGDDDGADATSAITLSMTNTTSLDLSKLTSVDTSADGITFTVDNVSAIASTITGAATVDTITGGNANDTITANAGADILSGGTGSDIIDAGAGADQVTFTLETALADTITGGTGADTFIMATTTAATIATKTVIKDFVVTGTNEIDNLDMSETALEGLTVIAGIINGGGTDVTGANDLGIEKISADNQTAAAGTDIFYLSGTYTNATALTAIQTAGSLTIDLNGAGASNQDNDGMLIAYSDASGHINIGIASLNGNAQANSGNADSLTDVVQLQGVTEAQFLTANIDLIA